MPNATILVILATLLGAKNRHRTVANAKPSAGSHVIKTNQSNATKYVRSMGILLRHPSFLSFKNATRATPNAKVAMDRRNRTVKNARISNLWTLLFQISLAFIHVPMRCHSRMKIMFVMW